MMTQTQSAKLTPTKVMAAGGGILAGMLTLLLLTLALRPVANNSPTDLTVTGSSSPDLAAGECFNFGEDSSISNLSLVDDCSLPHDAESVGQIDYPESAGAYPGTVLLAGWANENCTDEFNAYLGADLLTTSLEGEAIYPSASNWAQGDNRITCYLTSLEGTALNSSVADNAALYPRGNSVVVTRLLAGDCYRAQDGTDPTLLDSRGTVTITRCDELHHGVFFGRSQLNFGLEEEFPDKELLTSATKAACAQLFQVHFGESVLGFNFRYWRPSEASWAKGDRTVLCTILSSEGTTEPFDPSSYVPLVDTEIGQCFDFGPEERAATLGREDKVLIVNCTEDHLGQKLGGGSLNDQPDVSYPGDSEVEKAAGEACRQDTNTFIESTGFKVTDPKFWQPNEESWLAGDRRYACAYANDTASPGLSSDS